MPEVPDWKVLAENPDVGLVPVTIGGVQFDAMLELKEKFDATVPAYRSDTGFESSDDVIPNLMKVEMRLFVTPTPVTWMDRASHMGRNPQDVVDGLRALMEKRMPVFVATYRKNYDNMMIQKVTVNKSADMGHALEIDVSMVQIVKSPYGKYKMPENYEMSMGTTVGEVLDVGSEDGKVYLAAFSEKGHLTGKF